MPKMTMTGSEMAARMTPEARTERARKAAMARHYARLVPLMVTFLRSVEATGFANMDDYPTLQELPEDVRKWLYREARRAMGF